jgi:hypothetical protein
VLCARSCGQRKPRLRTLNVPIGKLAMRTSFSLLCTLSVVFGCTGVTPTITEFGPHASPTGLRATVAAADVSDSGIIVGSHAFNEGDAQQWAVQFGDNDAVIVVGLSYGGTVARSWAYDTRNRDAPRALHAIGRDLHPTLCNQ